MRKNNKKIRKERKMFWLVRDSLFKSRLSGQTSQSHSLLSPQRGGGVKRVIGSKKRDKGEIFK